MSALVQKYWSDHRVASVISLVLLFLGLMAKPWTLILVLLVAFGGPVLQRFDGFSESPIGAWRRSNWAISALAVAVALLATSGTDAGEGLLILALLPVAWTLAKDKTIFNRSSETPNKATRTVDDVSLKVEKDNSSVESKPSPQLQEKSSREELVGYIVENQSQPSNWLALKLGYKTTEGKADLYRFYNELMLSLGFPEELDSSNNKGDEIVDFIHQEQGGSSPILNGNEITGCYRVQMSREARIHNWDEEDWSEVQEQTEEMGLDGPYEVHESNSNELRCSAEDNFLDAFTGFQSLGGKFHDLLRIGYQGLGDDAYGMMINEYLEENEKHPFYYVELAQKLGLIADKKVISNNGAIHNTDIYAHQDQSEGSDGSDKIIESKPSTQLNAGLTGKELLDKIDSLGDVSTAKLLEACGYIIMEDDGIERRYYTKFYEALLQAKGITESIASDPEQNILEREQVDINSLAISRVPLQIKEGSGPFSTKVIESTIGKPDDDGDVSVDLKLSLSSYAEEDVELVVSKLVVLTASGLPLLEREDEHDVLITNGASEEISLYSGYFKASQIAGAPVSETQVLVQLTPCGCKFIDLPQVEIASPGNISGISETLQLLPNVQLRGFSALAPQPDDDGDCRLEFKGLLVNEYESVLNKVVVLIRIIDKNGREIDSTEWSDKVPPFSTVCFDTSLRGIKASRLAGSKVHVSIKAFQCLGNQAISWSVGSKPDPIEVEGGVANAGQQASASPKAPQSLSSDQASSLPSKDLEAGNCNAFDLEITTATYRKPDEDGDTRYEAQYSVINRSDQAIELLMARLFVLHPSGLVVATTEDESEDMAEKGESINASSSTWGTSVKELDGDPSSAQLLLQVTACSCSFQDLGSIECPSSGSTLTLKPKDQHDSGIVVEAITITAELPDDGECCLRIKALIKNKTTSTIPRAVLSTKLISSSGRELEDTYIQEEIAANNEVVLEDALWGVKENRINSASLQFNLKAFTAAGISSVATKNLSVED